MANYYINAQVKVDSSTVQAQLNKIKTSPIKLNVDTGNTNKELKQIVNSNGNVLSSFKQVGSQLGETNTKIKNTGTQMENLGTKTKDASKNILNLGGNFIETMGKVAKFYVITQIIQGVTQSITEAVSTIKEFDDALTDFKKVSDLSGDSLDAYTEKLGGLGETVARTRKHFLREYTVMYI